MNVMTIKEWLAEAERRFGTNTDNWKFKCVKCGHEQSVADFKALDLDPNRYAYFSCIGRFKEGIGCDWTLGGLFQIHKLEVKDPEDPEGKQRRPVFEFGEPTQSEGERQ